MLTLRSLLLWVKISDWRKISRVPILAWSISCVLPHWTVVIQQNSVSVDDNVCNHTQKKTICFLTDFTSPGGHYGTWEQIKIENELKKTFFYFPSLFHTYGWFFLKFSFSHIDILFLMVKSLMKLDMLHGDCSLLLVFKHLMKFDTLAWKLISITLRSFELTQTILLNVSAYATRLLRTHPPFSPRLLLYTWHSLICIGTAKACVTHAR